MKTIIISVLADDRPGIVEQLADCISAHQGNWLESRLANLAGQFAGIIRADVPADQEQRLTDDLQNLNATGIQVSIASTAPARETDISGSGVAATIRVTGSDRAGIVREITALLARQSVNVQELSSHCEHAPMSGDQLFHATFTVVLPDQLAGADLAHILEGISDDLMVDLEH